MRVVNRFQKETKGSLELLDHSLGESQELNIGVFVVEVFRKFGDTLGICICFKLESFAFEEDFELFVIRDDSIVNDGELPTWI